MSSLRVPSDSVAASGAPTEGPACITRSPVLDRHSEVWGFALSAPGVDPVAQPGSELRLLAALAEVGPANLAGGARLVVPVGPDTVSGRLPLPALGQDVYLQLWLAPQMVTPELMSGVEKRRKEGFRFVMYGYVAAPEVAALVHFGSVLRLTREQVDSGQLAAAGYDSSRHKLWLTGLEDATAVSRAVKHRAELFSGDFLLRPETLKRSRTPRNLGVLMQLMSKLRQKSVEYSDLEDILARDAGLSAMLIRFLNSGAFGARTAITSLRHALVLLGVQELSKWVTLVGLSEASVKPSEVLLTALVRAKACELLAAQCADASLGPTAFLVGLFSLLDAMLARPLEQITQELPLSDDVRVALLMHDGPTGEILAAVLDYERGLPSDRGLALDQVALSEAFYAAICWADGVRPALQSTQPVSQRRPRA